MRISGNVQELKQFSLGNKWQILFQEAWQLRRSSSDQKKETLSMASLSETVQKKEGLDSLLTMKHFCIHCVIETTIEYEVQDLNQDIIRFSTLPRC